jgi:hypothetical protein
MERGPTSSRPPGSGSSADGPSTMPEVSSLPGRGPHRGEHRHCVLTLGVLPGGRKPSTAMARLILVVAVPFLGFLAFLLFGSTTVGRKRRAQQEEVNAAILARVPLEDLTDEDRRGGLPGHLRGSVQLNRNLSVLSLRFGNSVELISDHHA